MNAVVWRWLVTNQAGKTESIERGFNTPWYGVNLEAWRESLRFRPRSLGDAGESPTIPPLAGKVADPEFLIGDAVSGWTRDGSYSSRIIKKWLE